MPFAQPHRNLLSLLSTSSARLNEEGTDLVVLRADVFERLGGLGFDDSSWSDDEMALLAAEDADMLTGQEVCTLHGHKGSVFGVSFSPDGRRLATSSGDGTVKIWDGTPLAETPTQDDRLADK